MLVGLNLGFWVGAWVVHGWCMGWCMGLVRLDLGFFGGLDGEGEELVGGVSCEKDFFGVCLYEGLSLIMRMALRTANETVEIELLDLTNKIYLQNNFYYLRP